MNIILIIVIFKWFKEIRQDRKEKKEFLRRYEEIRQEINNLKE